MQFRWDLGCMAWLDQLWDHRCFLVIAAPLRYFSRTRRKPNSFWQCMMWKGWPQYHHNLHANLSCLDPHVISSLASLDCNSLVFIHGGYKHDGDDDHHKTGWMAMEVTVEPLRWILLWCKRPYYSQYNMIICLWCLFSSHTILSCFYLRWMYFHNRILPLSKSWELWYPFFNSCTY
jgi:hypothetical protein